jgi:small-conductance mechanosensitive channel
MNKIAIAADNMNKLRDYLLVPSTNEAKEDDSKVADLKTKLSKEKDTDALEKQIVVLQGQINLLKTQLENEKNSTLKPEPNPETGEIPLRTGLAAAILDKNSPKPKVHSLDKKKLKMSLGKSKIEINPDVEMGLFSGGKKVPDGKLY